MLIEAGADVNAPNQIARATPLHCAVRGTFQNFRETLARRVQCVRLLLAAGADTRAQDKRGRDAFETVDDAVREAWDRNGIDIYDEMDAMYAALESAGEAGKSPLDKCIEAADVDGAWAAISEGATTRADLDQGLKKVAERFASLLDNDADVNGDTYDALKEILSLLLGAGANANAAPPPSDGRDPLEGASLHIIAAGLCAAYVSSPDAADVAAPTAGTAARRLRAHGAGLCAKTMALLPGAAHRGKVEAVSFLVDAVGVDVNHRGRQGMTGLIFAARGGRKGIVKLLLACEALDTEVKDNAGKTAMDYAKANKKEEIVELLQSRCLNTSGNNVRG